MWVYPTEEHGLWIWACGYQFMNAFCMKPSVRGPEQVYMYIARTAVHLLCQGYINLPVCFYYAVCRDSDHLDIP